MAKMKAVEQTKKCPICGKEFVPKHKRQKYCTSECSYNYQLEVQKTRKIPVECPICGKVFMGGPRSRTCSEECRNQYISSKMRRLHDQRRTEGAKPPSRKKKQIMKQRTELMKKVKASGMSYGQYLARGGVPEKIPEEMKDTVTTKDTWMNCDDVQVAPEQKKVYAHVKQGKALPDAPQPTRDSRKRFEQLEMERMRWLHNLFQEPEEKGVPEKEPEKNG